MADQNKNSIQQAKQAAVAAINSGQWLQAESILSGLVQSDSRDVSSWYQLAYCQMMTNKAKSAVDCLNHCLQLSTDFEPAYILLSHAYMRVNDKLSAIETLQKLIRISPESAEGYSLLGGAYMQNMQGLEAEECLEKSLQLNPDQLNTRLHLAALQTQLRKYDSAIDNLNTVLSSGQFTGEAHNLLGNVYQNTGKYDDAIIHYQAAIKLNPESQDALIGLGIVYEKTHRLDEAKDISDKVLSMDAMNVGANLLCGRVEKRNKNYDKALACLESAIATNLAHPNYSIITSELGHVLDKLGRYDAAYEAYEKANNAWLSVLESTQVDLDEYIQNIRTYQQWFSEQGQIGTEQTAYNDGISDPVFFVGFPRSGTTLMEQILEAHPDLISTHEETVIGSLKSSITKILDRPFELPKDIAGLAHNEILKLREYYISAVADCIGPEARQKRIIDKLPLNIINLGLINKIFPDAHIIVAIRDPRDVCLSCYMQTFDINVAMANFLSMENTTQLYAEVMKLYDIYKDNLDISVHEYQYENLVNDMSTTIKSIIEYLGLEWNENLLEYHKSARKKHVNTPSYQAVTEPIYSHATSRWKNYIKHIKPYEARLQPYLLKYGYNI